MSVRRHEEGVRDAERAAFLQRRVPPREVLVREQAAARMLVQHAVAVVGQEQPPVPAPDDLLVFLQEGHHEQC